MSDRCSAEAVRLSYGERTVICFHTNRTVRQQFCRRAFSLWTPHCIYVHQCEQDEIYGFERDEDVSLFEVKINRTSERVCLSGQYRRVVVQEPVRLMLM